MILWKTFAAVAVALSVAGCGNAPDQGKMFDAIKSGAFKTTGSGTAATPEQIQAGIAAAMQANDQPLMLVKVEARNSTSVLTRIETNGAYGTWASPDRRTMTLKRGMLTATRGLGNDVMSADVDRVSALISARKSGHATRVLRFLDGQNHTVELVADCTVTVGGRARVEGGAIKATTTRVNETCVAGDTQFKNSYSVDHRGNPVQSRQWLGPAIGHVTFQALRN